MFTLLIEELIDEVKSELYVFDELEEEKISEWESKFKALLPEKKFKTIKVIGEEIGLEDEADIFRIADDYFTAIENDQEEEYWENF